MSKDPSQKLHLREQGFSPWTCLDFDLAVNDYGDEFEEQLKATKQVPMSRAKRRKPTVPAPLHDHVQLKRFLGIPDEVIGVYREDDPELNRLKDEILSGTADWLLPATPGT